MTSGFITHSLYTILANTADVSHGRIQDFGMEGAQVERRTREYRGAGGVERRAAAGDEGRGAAGSEGVGFEEGVFPSPMEVGSGEGVCAPSPNFF